VSFDDLHRDVLELFAESDDQAHRGSVAELFIRQQATVIRRLGHLRVKRTSKTPEQRRAKQAEWYATNATREREKRRRWRALNRAKVAARNQRYHQTVMADPQRAERAREYQRVKMVRLRKRWAELAAGASP
jgi:hypothetical protein